MPISENLLTSIKNGKFKGDLNLCNKAIDDADATKLALALKENPYVTCLHLRNQNIGDIGIKAISEVTTIEELDVGNGADDYSEEFGNRITSVGAEALSKSCLKKLNISGNSIGDSGIKFLAESQTIVELIAEDCEISSVGAVSLFTRNALIKKLDLSDNPIGDEGISSISLNHKIEELNLSNCSITGNGSEHLAQNDTLIKLDLGENDLTNCSKNLIHHPTLKCLNLRDCKINGEASSCLANSNLETLLVNSNQITSQGTRSLSKNDNLSCLDISFNNMDENGLRDLIGMQSLKTLFAINNNVGEQGVSLLNEALNENKSSIIYANLVGNDMSTSLFINRKRKANDSLNVEGVIDGNKYKKPRLL